SRVLILIDASASMLDETVVNIIRLRNMPPERRIRSTKWQQAVNTIEWVLARLPDTTQFQVYAFDTQARPLVEGSAGRWLNVRDSRQTEAALAALRGTAPTGGTSLLNAFAVIKALQPAPDNVILVTDGLPTQGEKPPLVRTLVTMEQREDLMQDAVKSLPPAPPPVNVVLLPMEGDPSAPIFFWRLTLATGGGFLSPAKDWP
ncbi:MAG: vWA domain-containing protein, partial [Gammaproteobacteria bacterium]